MASASPCSSKTGQGLEELLGAIRQVSDQVETRSADGVFRMYIDRIFSVSGFGTVVTGTAGSGTLNMESKVYLLPGKAEPLPLQISEVRLAADPLNATATGALVAALTEM